jgi:hypothetical protein
MLIIIFLKNIDKVYKVANAVKTSFKIVYLSLIRNFRKLRKN